MHSNRFCFLLLLMLFLTTTGSAQAVTEVYPLMVNFRADRGSLSDSILFPIHRKGGIG